MLTQCLRLAHTLDTIGLLNDVLAWHTLDTLKRKAYPERYVLPSFINVDATNLSNTFTNIHDRLLPHIADKSLIVVVNKCDLVDETDLYTAFNDVYEHSGINPDETIFISAKTGNNISALESKLNDYTLQNQYGKSDVIVTNLRHAEALRQALDSLRRANETMKDGISTDLVAEDLRLCLNSLGEIVGEVTNDEVLGNIFSHFCVGK